MKIKWYGHACFRVEGGGISIVTDPYTPGVAGPDPVDEPADVVIMSSATDRFHSCSSMVPGDPEVHNALELEGVSVLHLGDLGNPIPDEQLARLRGRVDILLALTGGPLTIELDDLDRAIEEIEPSIVIPMHYKIPCLRLGILPLEAFTTRYPQNVVESPTLEGSVSGASSILDTLTFYVR